MIESKKRRVLQFSLRFCFVFFTLISFYVAWLVHRAERQRAAVHWIEANGGSVTFRYEKVPAEYNMHEGGRPQLPHPPVSEWVLRFLDIHFFSDVVGVNLESCEVRDVSPLYALSELTYLNIGDTGISENDVNELKVALPDCEIIPPDTIPVLDPFVP